MIKCVFEELICWGCKKLHQYSSSCKVRNFKINYSKPKHFTSNNESVRNLSIYEIPGLAGQDPKWGSAGWKQESGARCDGKTWLEAQVVSPWLILGPYARKQLYWVLSYGSVSVLAGTWSPAESFGSLFACLPGHSAYFQEPQSGQHLDTKWISSGKAGGLSLSLGFSCKVYIILIGNVTPFF